MKKRIVLDDSELFVKSAFLKPSFTVTRNGHCVKYSGHFNKAYQKYGLTIIEYESLISASSAYTNFPSSKSYSSEEHLLFICRHGISQQAGILSEQEDLGDLLELTGINLGWNHQERDAAQKELWKTVLYHIDRGTTSEFYDYARQFVETPEFFEVAR